MSTVAPAGSPPPMSGAVASPQIVTASPPALTAVVPSPAQLATPSNAPYVPPAVSAVPPNVYSSPPIPRAVPPNVYSLPPLPTTVAPTVSTSKPSPSSPDVSHSQPKSAPHTITSSRTPPTTGTPSPSSSSSSSSSTPLLIGIAAAGLVAIVFLSIFLYCCLKAKKKKNRNHGGIGGKQLPSVAALKAGGKNYHPNPCASASNPLPDHNVASAGSSAGKIPIQLKSSQTAGSSHSWFNYDELYTATDGFAPSNVLGEGGFGCVYKGKLPSGQAVAVKQLTVSEAQGDHQFRAEVEIITRVHHRHLVSLVGYCIADNFQRFLVYDFVPNGTLDDHLHGKKRGMVMDWATRMRVALGSARGLAYLHEDCHPRIIHRDIKASNILLDNNFEAQVADFGLAKLEPDAHTHVTTRVVGTFGYLAPEYAASGKLTEKSDVFSFGVVLLELITGRKPVDTRQPIGDESLVEWARPLMMVVLEDRNVEPLVDPELGNDYDEKEMFCLIEAAAACVCHTASKRPKMSQVVRALEFVAENPGLHQGSKPAQSLEHNSNFSVSHFGEGSSDYDTQQNTADNMQKFHKVAAKSKHLGSEYTNTTGASSKWEANTPSIKLGSDPSYGQLSTHAREHEPVSVRTKNSWVPRPIRNSRLGGDNSTGGPVQQHGALQRQLSSGSVESGSIRRDIMALPPPLPPGYSNSSNWSWAASGVKSGSGLITQTPPPVPRGNSSSSSNYSSEDISIEYSSKQQHKV